MLITRLGLVNGKYWAKMDEMSALVEPLPLVPEMWMGLSRSKSDGYGFSVHSSFIVFFATSQTSYPSLRHHSIISGIEFLFMLLPDFLIASTMEKFDWSVFSAAIAS